MNYFNYLKIPRNASLSHITQACQDKRNQLFNNNELDTDALAYELSKLKRAFLYLKNEIVLYDKNTEIDFLKTQLEDALSLIAMKDEFIRDTVETNEISKADIELYFISQERLEKEAKDADGECELILEQNLEVEQDAKDRLIQEFKSENGFIKKWCVALLFLTIGLGTSMLYNASKSGSMDLQKADGVIIDKTMEGNSTTLVYRNLKNSEIFKIEDAIDFWQNEIGDTVRVGYKQDRNRQPQYFSVEIR